MRRQHPFHAVIGIRRRQEEMEERKLVEIVKQLREAEDEQNRIKAELHRLTAARVDQLNEVVDVTHHRAAAAELSAVLRRSDVVTASIKNIEEQKGIQMAAYLSARSGRKIIEDLDRQRLDAERAVISRQEQRRTEELFLARRVLGSDIKIL
jgi:molybdopterin/thiamine biosynthesis adenylyltransferase